MTNIFAYLIYVLKVAPRNIIFLRYNINLNKYCNNNLDSIIAKINNILQSLQSTIFIEHSLNFHKFLKLPKIIL